MNDLKEGLLEKDRQGYLIINRGQLERLSRLEVERIPLLFTP